MRRDNALFPRRLSNSSGSLWKHHLHLTAISFASMGYADTGDVEA